MSDMTPCGDRNCVLRLRAHTGQATNGGCTHTKGDAVEMRRALVLVSRRARRLHAVVSAVLDDGDVSAAIAALQPGDTE